MKSLSKEREEKLTYKYHCEKMFVEHYVGHGVLAVTGGIVLSVSCK